MRFTFTGSEAARSPSSRPSEVHHLISKVQGLECPQKENTVLSSEHGAEPQPQWKLEGQMINCFNQEHTNKKVHLNPSLMPVILLLPDAFSARNLTLHSSEGMARWEPRLHSSSRPKSLCSVQKFSVYKPFLMSQDRQGILPITPEQSGFLKFY